MFAKIVLKRRHVKEQKPKLAFKFVHKGNEKSQKDLVIGKRVGVVIKSYN